jgi:hypothetical protein
MARLDDVFSRGIEICWLTSLFKPVGSENSRYGFHATPVQCCLVTIKLLLCAAIRRPSHPFWLGWEFSFVWIEGADSA